MFAKGIPDVLLQKFGCFYSDYYIYTMQYIVYLVCLYQFNVTRTRSGKYLENIIIKSFAQIIYK